MMPLAWYSGLILLCISVPIILQTFAGDNENAADPKLLHRKYYDQGNRLHVPIWVTVSVAKLQNNIKLAFHEPAIPVPGY
uniref:Putative secreted protein n=1 Tax=Anopheles darlingi TaxID=43151 RepID=A0A2M4D577_ANODA